MQDKIMTYLHDLAGSTFRRQETPSIKAFLALTTSFATGIMLATG